MTDRTVIGTLRRSDPSPMRPIFMAAAGTSHAILDRMHVRSLLVCIPLLAACSSSSAGDASHSGVDESTVQGAQAACTYPAGTQADDGGAAIGCFAGPSGKLCEVSNGATVEPDGSVSGGTESCTLVCPGSQYEMNCRGDITEPGSIPAPASALGCTVIPEPTPSNALFYCCPCAP